MRLKKAIPILFAALTAAVASADNFSYTNGTLEATFIGSGGSATGSFTVIAPSPKKDGAFPNGETSATADIRIKDIEKVADENGDPLLDSDGDPTSQAVHGALLQTLKSAFTFNPSFHTFAPSESKEIIITVTNPNVGSSDYGDYSIVTKCHDRSGTGQGIGEAAGVRFLLKLRAATYVDTVAPEITIVKPTGDHILGSIPVEYSAKDPVPGSGLNSVTASVASAGGIALSLTGLTTGQSLPLEAGLAYSVSGTFNPAGWTGTAGTSLANAFTIGNRSGIGEYDLKVDASDLAGNVSSKSQRFAVNYDVAIDANQIGNLNNDNSTAQIRFTAKRSSVTSDGLFMFDTTVVVQVWDGATLVGQHLYGTGGIGSYVQIDATNVRYQTNFKRGDLAGADNAKPYTIKVFFMDVDGNMRLQGTTVLTF